MDKEVKSILCFGDSNTYGVNPDTEGRFNRAERWTGRLSALMGDGYYVIEEGYNGRTTCFSDDSDPNRSGYKALDIILKSHMPLDLIIVMLGTNDFKAQYSMTAKASANGIKKIVEKIRKYSISENKKVPEILIVSPIMMGEAIENSMFWECGEKERLELQKVPELYKMVAAMTHCHYFAASSVAYPGLDMLHMTKESHKALADSLSKLAEEILK